MKKYILPIILVLGIVLVSMLVSAKMMVLQDDGLRYRYKTSVQLEKGWNLIGGFKGGVNPESEIKTEDLKVIYLYNPLNKNYVSVYPRSSEYDNLIFNNLICGDNVCDPKEKTDYSTWCSKDCWQEFPIDIMNNLKITNKQKFTVGLNERKQVNLGVFNFEFYLEKGPDYLQDGVRLQTKISDRPDFYAVDYYKNSATNDYNKARLIEGNPSFFGENPKEPSILYALIQEPENGVYNVQFYELPTNTFAKSTGGVPTMQDKITSQSAWVYSTKKGTIVYEYTKLKLENIELNSGWNFMTLTPEMVGKNILELKGDCNIEKVFGWEPDRKTWNDLLDEQLPEEATGAGFIIKVSNSCKLENMGGGNNGDNPPQLPEVGDNNPPDTTNSDFPKTIGEFTLKSQNTNDKLECGQLEGNKVCIIMGRYEYVSADNTAIHVLPTKITVGKEAYINYIKTHSSENNVDGISNVYRGVEPWELYWFTSNGYDMIGTQDYKYIQQSDGSVNSQSFNATTTDSVTKWLLNKYQPINV